VKPGGSLVAGTFVVRRRGQAQVVPDGLPAGRRFLIDEAGAGGAIHGDRVFVRPQRARGAGDVPYATVEKVVERARDGWAGIVRLRADGACLEPADGRYPVMTLVEGEAGGRGDAVAGRAPAGGAGDVPVGGAADAPGAAPVPPLRQLDGLAAMAKVISYARGRHPVVGRVVEVLGLPGDPGVDIALVARKHGLPLAFPRAVLAEAATVPREVAASALAGRVDLRDCTVFSIDGEDAKDLDDAVSLEDLGNGAARLGVHIADVSHYVLEGAVLDREAAHRTTSVYLVDRVLPMLPPDLSNGICSLNAGVDRLTVSAFIEFDAQGDRRRYSLARSVIRSAARLTYKQVAFGLDAWKPSATTADPAGSAGSAGSPSLPPPLPAALLPHLQAMRELALKLRARRMERGALDFEFPEDRVVLDERGRPQAVLRYERTIADQIIEEFMLAANEAVAEHLRQAALPAIYRVHEEPAPESLRNLGDFLRGLGFSVKIPPDKVHPRVFQQVLERAGDTREARIVQMALLRSLARARYDDRPRGHFALSVRDYLHFTSPIRRYPDLCVHRVLTEALAAGVAGSAETVAAAAGAGAVTAADRRQPLPPSKLARWRDSFSELANRCSIGERVAAEAERESVDVKKTEFVAPLVGQEFGGVVTGVESFGFWVEMEMNVEGLVHVSSLSDDYYIFDPRHLTLVGRRTKRAIAAGRRVRVRIARVNVNERLIDLELAGR
jgi:ribonuclease R